VTAKRPFGNWAAIGTAGALIFALLLTWGGRAIAAPPNCIADTIAASEDGSVLIDVLANDGDGGVPPLTLSSLGNPFHGTASIEGGKVRYTPSENFCGTDTFTYTAQNADGTDTALVTVTVACQNDGPIAMDAVVTTSEEIAISFMLEAQDFDIDPMMPQAHPLSFEIIDGPKDGNVYGDFTAVTYTLTHLAAVEVTYTPNPGFTGTDGFLFRVTDPYGLTSTARVNIEVRPAGVPVVNFGATSRGALTFSGSPLAVDLTSTEFTAFYQVGTLLLEAQTEWEENTWEKVSLKMAFALGEAVHVNSTLTFDPLVPAFDSWNMTSQFELSGVHVSHTFLLGPTQTESSSVLSASWSEQGVSCWCTLRFTGCELSFDGATVNASWGWPDCSINLWASLSMGRTGFQNVMFTLQNIQLPFLLFSPSFLSLNVNVSFTTESKTVSPSLQLRSVWAGCLQPLFRLEGAGGNIEGFELYGWRIQWGFPDGISVWADTSLNEEDNASVTGYSNYFERFVVWVPIDSCCGIGGQCQAGIYFQRESVELFDLGMIAIDMELPLADQLILKSGIIWRSVQPPAVDPAWEWEVGWTAFWG
jgi:hypothetical protein